MVSVIGRDLTGLGSFSGTLYSDENDIHMMQKIEGLWFFEESVITDDGEMCDQE